MRRCFKRYDVTKQDSYHTKIKLGVVLPKDTPKMGLFSSPILDSLGPDSRRKMSIYLLPDIGTTYGTMSPAGLPVVVGSSHHSGVLLWNTLYHIGCYGDGGVYQQCDNSNMTGTTITRGRLIL